MIDIKKLFDSDCFFFFACLYHVLRACSMHSWSASVCIMSNVNGMTGMDSGWMMTNFQNNEL